MSAACSAMRLATALLAAVAGAPAAAQAATAARAGVIVGIGDQKPDMFEDPRFADLGIAHVRRAVAWDAMSSVWQVDELDRWLDAARAAGAEPLISFSGSRTRTRSLPTPRRLAREFRRFRHRYPWVTTFATWNEPNHCGQPTCRRPRLVARFYRALRRECPSCTILAPEVLDIPNMAQWVRAFRTALGFSPKRWGLHNYVEANRFRMRRLRLLLRMTPRSELWLTETGGLVRRNNGSRTAISEGARHAADVTRYIFDRIVPSNPRVRRVYIYHWNAGPRSTTWDSGLITYDGRKRSAMFVLARVIHFGLRPQTSTASFGRGASPG